MRRASAWLTLLALVSLAFAAVAAAAPTVTFKVTPIPIPGFPGTGNILGAGAEVEAQVTISGTEYGGFPSPLTGMSFYAPAGVNVTPTGFVDCASSALEARGAQGCPKNSSAGLLGYRWCALRTGADDRSTAGPNRARRRRRLDPLVQSQGRRRVQEGQEHGLLHHAAEEMPEGGLPVKAELKFMSGETVTVAYKHPCPRRK